mmetsp:Transcript_61670/g.201262  ORF Transcript_61670/g.201262 Transcript_61670/m.201262 type:complete len:192 (+) Transcript_61670:123-698(+)
MVCDCFSCLPLDLLDETLDDPEKRFRGPLRYVHRLGDLAGPLMSSLWVECKLGGSSVRHGRPLKSRSDSSHWRPLGKVGHPVFSMHHLVGARSSSRTPASATRRVDDRELKVRLSAGYAVRGRQLALGVALLEPRTKEVLRVLALGPSAMTVSFFETNCVMQFDAAPCVVHFDIMQDRFSRQLLLRAKCLE